MLHGTLPFCSAFAEKFGGGGGGGLVVGLGVNVSVGGGVVVMISGTIPKF